MDRYFYKDNIHMANRHEKVLHITYQSNANQNNKMPLHVY